MNTDDIFPLLLLIVFLSFLTNEACRAWMARRSRLKAEEEALWRRAQEQADHGYPSGARKHIEADPACQCGCRAAIPPGGFMRSTVEAMHAAAKAAGDVVEAQRTADLLGIPYDAREDELSREIEEAGRKAGVLPPPPDPPPPPPPQPPRMVREGRIPPKPKPEPPSNYVEPGQRYVSKTRIAHVTQNGESVRVEVTIHGDQAIPKSDGYASRLYKAVVQRNWPKGDKFNR